MTQELPEYIQLLLSLIKTPSLSGSETETADLLFDYLSYKGVEVHRKFNNVFAFNKYFDPNKTSILINSHHDTVKPSQAYSFDPFTPFIKDGKIFGMGSNDAGGSMVSLIRTFLHFCERTDLKYNLILLLTAEEEISGKKGMKAMISDFSNIEFAMVGEPTGMDIAIAEKGLMVLNCTAKGVSGHAAVSDGQNAIYQAMEDIRWFKNFRFPRVSPTLGPVRMTVTIINSGTQHNVIPDNCEFTVDVRTTDAYSNHETLRIIQENIKSEVQARSTVMQPSFFDENHLVTKKVLALGKKSYGSPTLSDQSLIPYPSFKMGPGHSERSHIADECIGIDEIEAAIEIYQKVLSEIL